MSDYCLSLDLNTALERDGAKLVSLDYRKQVKFICKCGATHSKPKKAVCATSGAFCKDCTDKNTSIKRIRTKIAYMNSILETNPAV